MTTRRDSTLWGYATMALCVLLLVAWAIVRHRAGMGFGPFDTGLGLYVLVQVALGGLITLRRPKNPIGWLLVGASLCWAASLLSGDLALAGASSGATWPSWAAWAGQIGFMPGVVVIPWLLPMIFPDGRLVSPRWRVAVWVGAASAFGAIIGAATAPELPDYPGIAPPFAVTGVAADVTSALNMVAWLGVVVLTLLSVVPVVIRYRQAGAVVRQQLRWLLFGFGLVALCMLTAGALFPLWPTISNAVILVGLSALPVCITIAILRHRLFDIDRLISRTVSYAVVTAVLVGAYLGTVLLLSAATRALGGSSDLAVAVSTLTVAALFQPVRARIQSAVDRRFNRRRYDAVRTVEEFGATLRDEVKLANLAADLRHVVGATVAPTHASVWMTSKEQA